MVREYVQSYYVPAAAAASRVDGDGYAGARELAAYRSRVADAWPRVRVLGGELTVDGPTPPVIGAMMRVRAKIDLAGLQPSDVDVQVVVGKVDDADELREIVTASMRSVSDGEYVADLRLPHAGPLGYTVRVLPRHDLLATPAELGRVVLAT
jgi:starch phosphorylase